MTTKATTLPAPDIDGNELPPSLPPTLEGIAAKKTKTSLESRPTPEWVLRLESELGEIDGKIRDLSAAKGGSFGEFHAHQQLRSVHEQVEVARRLREILIRRLADFHEAAAREYYFLSKQHENLERGF